MGELTVRVADTYEVEEEKARIADISDIIWTYDDLVEREKATHTDYIMQDRSFRYLYGLSSWINFRNGRSEKCMPIGAWLGNYLINDEEVLEYVEENIDRAIVTAKRLRLGDKVSQQDIEDLEDFFGLLEEKILFAMVRDSIYLH